uniref:Yippee domain-containing protein n=1 Tax=Nelumbo nucifera TaxID=4432 RepID=A0A822YVP7_NELNU|nr:TPA_asm: hypothetical protein HUJ06_006833 [Nelumbo nucifera]
MAEIVGPRVYSCYNCRNHVSLHDDVISKAFQVKLLHWFSFYYKFLTIRCLMIFLEFSMFIALFSLGSYILFDIKFFDLITVLAWFRQT